MPHVDAHLHVFARVSDDFPRETDGLPPEREEPAEKLLAQMETHGVSQAVLTQIGGSQLAHHAYLKHCLKTYADRFLGIGLVPDDAPSPADHMDRVAEDGGVIGFRLLHIGGPSDFRLPIDIREFATYPIWAHAAKKDYVIWLYPTGSDAQWAPFLMDAFPQVRVVMNHLAVCPDRATFTQDADGRPHIETPMPPRTAYTTLGLHLYENVCVHLSGQYAFSKEAWPYRDLADWHRCLLETFGARRLMWASDFPWILDDPGYGALTRVIDELLPGLTAQERADIMGGTARRFLRFPDIPRA